MSWVWLDGVEHFEKGSRVQARKKWEAGFPRLYLVEMMAQAGAILLGAENGFTEDVVFTKIEAVEFLAAPVAGENLEIFVEADALRREAGWFRGEIFQKGERVVRGRVLLMNVGRLRQDGVGPITFPEPLTEGLKVA